MNMIYINELISSGLSNQSKYGTKDIKTGYVVTIEKEVLDNFVGTKEDLKEII